MHLVSSILSTVIYVLVTCETITCTSIWNLVHWCAIHSFRLRDNSVHFHECSPLLVGISTKFIYTVKMFEIVFPFNVKDSNVFPCLHNITYNI